MTMTEEQIETFLKRPLVAVLGTVDNGGRPRAAPTWFHWEDGAAYMFTSRTSLKWRNIQRRPYASLCVDWREVPYEGVILDGLVEESDRPIHELVLAMSLRYYGEDHGRTFAEQYRGQRPDIAAFALTPRRIASFVSD